jgi:hypothetical protein
MATGIKIENIIGDAAYSEKGNIEFSRENNIHLVAKLNPSDSQGFRKKAEKFEFNKDAGMYVCKAGHMAIRKARQGKKSVSTNQVDTYYFDIQKCKRCPFKDGCYKEEPKARPIPLPLSQRFTKNRKHFRKVSISKKSRKNDIKLKQRIAN